jgi:formylglycine-generating enzyme required for sulfatase activity
VGGRLPTEAEWEYAARGGVTAPRYGFLSAIAWSSANSGGQTHLVAGRAANQYDLHDMFGNVYEWVNDWKGAYSAESQVDPQGPAEGDNRMLRGGSWSNEARFLRASSRNWDTPDGRFYNIGFRCVGDERDFIL